MLACYDYHMILEGSLPQESGSPKSFMSRIPPGGSYPVDSPFKARIRLVQGYRGEVYTCLL